MPNGSGGESSSRKRRKDQEVHVAGLHVVLCYAGGVRFKNKTLDVV